MFAKDEALLHDILRRKGCIRKPFKLKTYEEVHFILVFLQLTFVVFGAFNNCNLPLVLIRH